MDFMLALNVTIYGLGIVFLALLVLMVAIMLLTKVFAVVTGRDVLSAVAVPAPSPPLIVPAGVTVTAPAPAPAPVPAAAAEAVTAPLPGKVLSVAVKAGDRVQKGDELCVIEAMKMGNSVKAPREGFVTEVCVAQGNTVAFGAPLVFLASTAAASRPPAPVAAPAAPTPVETAERSAFTLGIAGKTHAVELVPAGAGALAVLFDGTRYEVRRDAGDRAKLVVNGQAHTVEVKEVAGSTATVVIDGRTERVEIAHEAASLSASAAAVASTPTPTAPAARAGQPVTAPLPGKVLSVAVKAGDRVQKGDELCVIEAMKMGNSVKAQREGTVREVLVASGQAVAFGAPLLVLE
jgi:glutaconyl-CoA decarboxylase